MQIYLHFYGSDAITFGSVEGVISEIQEICIAQERMELKRIRKEIPELSKANIDDAIARLEKPTIQHQVVRVSAAVKGSLGLYLILTAFGYWVLEKTLAETVTEAWKESDMHKKVKQFFLKGRGDKMRAIQEAINSKVQKPTVQDSHTNFDLEVPMFAKLDEQNSVLSVRIDCSEEIVESEVIPTYEELLVDDAK